VAYVEFKKLAYVTFTEVQIRWLIWHLLKFILGGLCGIYWSSVQVA